MKDGAAPSTAGVAAIVRQRIEQGSDRLWRLEDFADLPFTAVAQALSRLHRRGLIERLSKGTYYRGRLTAFGKSRPNPAAVRQLAARRASLFPSGLSAANLLGFSTQIPHRSEISTVSGSLPRKLVGEATVVHTRRPRAWTSLTETQAALLDFLRRRGAGTELTPEDTARRLVSLLSTGETFERLAAVAATEPPRVRAMLGALGAELGKSPEFLAPLRRSLNPLSKFDFGPLRALRYAREWQAKETGAG